MWRAFLLVISLWLIFAGQASHANEPKKGEPEKIPAPKQVFPPPPTVVPSMPGGLPPGVIYIPPRPHPGTREVWQYYGVNSLGQFRPRVILAPGGSYDYRTLQPYPWVTNRPTQFMPYVVD